MKPDEIPNDAAPATITDPLSAETPADNPTAPSQTQPATVAAHVAGALSAESLQASLSAVAHATADDFEAVGSAMGFVTVGGDAVITASMTPLVHAKGDIHIRQSYASGVLAGGDMDISQAGAPIIVGKRVSVEQGGGVVMLAGEAEVSNSFVGVLLTPNATLAEDTTVLLSTRAALIIAAAIFGGFTLVAVVMALGVRRAMKWRPSIHVPQLPSIHVPQMPDLAALAEHLRRRDAA